MKLLLVIFVLCILVEQMFCDIQTPGPPSIVSDKEYRKTTKGDIFVHSFLTSSVYVFLSFF